MVEKFLFIGSIFVATFVLLCVIGQPPSEDLQELQESYPHHREIDPRPSHISTPMPDYKPYFEIVEQLREWHQESLDLTEIGVYGKSAKGTDLWYIRITNFVTPSEQRRRPIVLMTGATHGNESISSMTILAYAGELLSKYGRDRQITELVNTRDIYIIPIVSPDTFPHSRHVNRVDPNRDYPTFDDPNKRSIPIIQSLRDFVLKIQPNAIISGHSFGKVFIYPWGDTALDCPNKEDYLSILSEMQNKSGYKMLKLSKVYGRPIYGTEADWYYRQGFFSVVAEYGNHQKPPTFNEIRKEFLQTFKAILYFIEVAPQVRVKQLSFRSAA